MKSIVLYKRKYEALVSMVADASKENPTDLNQHAALALAHSDVLSLNDAFIVYLAIERSLGDENDYVKYGERSVAFEWLYDEVEAGVRAPDFDISEMSALFQQWYQRYIKCTT